MKWIGLTGGIATGKSTVSAILRDLGRSVIDADVLARDVVRPGSPGLGEIIKTFGGNVLTPNGELDRKKLGEIVFSDEHKREQLEAILHPLIEEKRAEARRALERQGCELAFYDVPLLFEKNLQDEFDATVLVYAHRDLQAKRLRERSGMSDDEISRRLGAQLPIDEKLPRATHVLRNEGSLADLRQQVKALVAKLE